MKKYTAVIVDDESKNIELLSHFLQKYCPRVEVIKTCTSRKNAIEYLSNENPDIVFMDIRLDIGTGFDVLKAVDLKNSQIIFVTAYNEYALKAFKFNVVDYILKPIDIEDLIKAVNTAIERINRQEPINLNLIESLIESINPKDNSLDFVAIPTIDKIDFIKTNQIIYLKSDGKYTEFHLLDGKIIISSKNIGEYNQLLDSNKFFRIHNSYIVNIYFVKEINKTGGNYIELINDISLPIAKRRQIELHKFIKIK